MGPGLGISNLHLPICRSTRRRPVVEWPSQGRKPLSEKERKEIHIFARSVEGKALSQFHDAMKQPFAVRGALMADAHAGYSLPIGGVVATAGVIVPAWVGYDIGCGMCALPTSYQAAKVKKAAEKIFKAIYAAVPVGFSHNDTPTPWDWEHRPATPELKAMMKKRGLKQLGSLGGGNHFIEIGADARQQVWVIIHSGSRGIGHDIAAHHMRVACGGTRAREGHFGLEVTSSEGRAYLADLTFCLDFALANRREIMLRVVSVLDGHLSGEAHWDDLINRNHNHAELREVDGQHLWIHRKGATHAEKGMMGVIPGNMRDGSFIVRGKGNPNSLWSSSHGAGRVMGRAAAKRKLDMREFNATMHGITARVERSTLDESPRAYKDIFSVMKQQKDLVEVTAHVKPIINIKG
jgi:tRNA-splicing ligase RtcB